jgi:hypothetical protein
MNKSKLAVDVDADRLVRDLLEAFSSLKAIPAPPTDASAYPSEEQKRSDDVQNDRDRASEHVGEIAVSNSVSVESRPEPAAPAEVLTAAVSDVGEEEQDVRVPERAESPRPSVYFAEAPKTRREIMDDFCAETEVLKRHNVTPEELHALSRVSMLGIMTSKEDLLFMLRQIREAANPTIPEEADLPEPEPLQVPEEMPEPPPSETAQMTERIRREALEKLPRWQARRDAERRRAQLGSFFMAVGSVAAMAGRHVITTLKSS